MITAKTAQQLARKLVAEGLMDHADLSAAIERAKTIGGEIL